MNTVKNMFFLLSFCLLANAVQAQIAIGPRLGINIANFGGDDADGADALVGLQIGATAQININEMFAFQPELMYFQKGTQQSFDFFGQSFDIETRLNYFEVPLLVKAMFGDSEGLQFFATAGPSLGFGINGKVTADGESEDIDFDDGLKRLDIGLSIGAGVQLPAGPGTFTGDLRYLLGLTSLDDTDDDVDVKNRGIGLSVGYLFPIGN